MNEKRFARRNLISFYLRVMFYNRINGTRTMTLRDVIDCVRNQEA